jgi:hypothetical protein
MSALVDRVEKAMSKHYFGAPTDIEPMARASVTETLMAIMEMANSDDWHNGDVLDWIYAFASFNNITLESQP